MVLHRGGMQILSLSKDRITATVPARWSTSSDPNLVDAEVRLSCDPRKPERVRLQGMGFDLDRTVVSDDLGRSFHATASGYDPESRKAYLLTTSSGTKDVQVVQELVLRTFENGVELMVRMDYEAALDFMVARQLGLREAEGMGVA